MERNGTVLECQNLDVLKLAHTVPRKTLPQIMPLESQVLIYIVQALLSYLQMTFTIKDIWTCQHLICRSFHDGLSLKIFIELHLADKDFKDSNLLSFLSACCRS